MDLFFFRSCEKIGVYKIVASVSSVLTGYAQPHSPFLSTWEQVQRCGARSQEQVSAMFCVISVQMNLHKNLHVSHFNILCRNHKKNAALSDLLFNCSQ